MPNDECHLCAQLAADLATADWAMADEAGATVTDAAFVMTIFGAGVAVCDTVFDTFMLMLLLMVLMLPLMMLLFVILLSMVLVLVLY